MTDEKREPFARVDSHWTDPRITTQPIKAYVLRVQGMGPKYFEFLDPSEIAESVNAAHEARVKEEVRKAVEEFRERAALKCERRAESLVEGKAVANLCARDVRAIVFGFETTPRTGG